MRLLLAFAFALCACTIGLVESVTPGDGNYLDILTFVDVYTVNKYMAYAGNNDVNAAKIVIEREITYHFKEATQMFKRSGLPIEINRRPRIIFLPDSAIVSPSAITTSNQIDADLLLSSFNNYVKAKNYKDLFKYDLAALFTGLDLAEIKGGTVLNKGVAGKAYVGVVCKQQNSLVMELTGTYSTSYFLAHEIGHTFSYSHDDGKPGCQNFYIMRSSLGASSPNRWRFSSCATQNFTAYINSLSDNCLKDSSFSHPNPTPKNYIPPSLNDDDALCKRAFGSAAQSCGKYIPGTCAKRACLKKPLAPGVRTFSCDYIDASDGMSCSKSGVCDDGVCVGGSHLGKRSIPVEILPSSTDDEVFFNILQD